MFNRFVDIGEISLNNVKIIVSFTILFVEFLSCLSYAQHIPIDSDQI